MSFTASRFWLALAFTATCVASPVVRQGVGERRLQSLPLVFEPNEGQAAPHVRFIARSGRMLLMLDENGSSVSFRAGSGEQARSIRLNLIGGRATAPAAAERLPGRSNYFIGADRSQWRAGIPHYGQVRYSDVYPGIDWVYYGKDGELEYDFIVRPGADPAKIRLAIRDARKVSVTKNGDLELDLGDGTVIQRAPVVYQDLAEGRKMVAARYEVRGTQVGFRVAEYDRSQPLVIDPVLTYARYVGGNATEVSSAISVDGAGNAWIAGQTTSTAQLATGGAPYTTFRGGIIDAFVAKISPAGAILFSTYYGGSGNDLASGVAVDATGGVYITGATASTNLPLVSAFRTTPAGVADAFVARLNGTTGAILMSSYLGGNGQDSGTGIATDGTSAYVVGGTSSTDWPPGVTSGAVAGGTDAFVAKVTGSTLAWVRFLGGTDEDNGLAVAVRGTSVWIAGTTTSPTVAALQPAASAGLTDGFAALFNTSGALVTGRRLGGSAGDVAGAIAVDSAGNAWVGGDTGSANFPVQGAWMGALQGGRDGFLASVTPAGAIAYSTFIGGSNDDSITGVAIDPVTGVVYVGGTTLSTNFTFTTALTGRGLDDAFVVALRPGNNAVEYSTAFGGTAPDRATAIAADAAGGVYLTGYTTSAGITGAAGTLNGGQDGFLARIQHCTFTLGTAADIGSAGGSGTIAVSAPAGCAWTATTNDAFIQFTSASGTGSGNITYNVSANAGGSRTGTVRLGNSSSAFTQAAAGSGNPGGEPGSGNPDLVSLSPLSGSGTSVTATAVYRHPGGQNSHYLGYLLFLPLPNVVSFNAQGTCLIEFNRMGGAFDGRGGVRLIDNAGTGWLGRLVGEPARPGTPPLVNNACTVNVAGVTVAFSGTDMVVTVPVTFHNPAALSQTMGTFIQSLSSTGQWTDFRQFGNWTVPGAPVRPGPRIVSGTPASGAGASANFTIRGSHTSGYTNLGEVHIRIAPSIVGSTPCHIIYSPAANVMSIINDAQTALIGPVPLGQPLTTNRCSVPAGATRAVLGSTDVVLNLPVNFNAAAFGAGTKNVYVNGFDPNGAVTHWIQTGTWTVQ